MIYPKKALAIGALALVALGGTAVPVMADSHMPAPPTAAAAPKGHTPVAPMDSHMPVAPLDRHRPILAGEGHTPLVPLDSHIP
ncbi:hypothetical protein [Streptomyces sp. 2323.1]|uniref:hypothetical protein n=1 Tax=Streptomyces TaxID=1883 RepID=UPI000BB801E1|nr:hypothetical protein [Streptomyces sp. 2323.1]SOE13057.1 hypothetical protein SAMN06272775_4039 [Streptomyces sp. 2323.1]